jgi:hypothetical protein
MPPGQLVGRRVGVDSAREVDVVVFLQVLSVHHPAQGQFDTGRNCGKQRRIHTIFDSVMNIGMMM